jgi:hypothetical protein
MVVLGFPSGDPRDISDLAILPALPELCPDLDLHSISQPHLFAGFVDGSGIRVSRRWAILETQERLQILANAIDFRPFV